MVITKDDNSQFIIIGKYWISKMVMMSEPCQLYVTNRDTNECRNYYSDQLFKLLRNEGLDPEPLDEYFDKLHGITKEERILTLRKYNEWEEANKMKKEDNKLKK